MSLGHKRVGFISDRDLKSALTRRSAFMECMSTSGSMGAGGLSSRQSQSRRRQIAMTHLLASPIATAVLTSNDLTAIGALAHSPSGLRVPDDISIIGLTTSNSAIHATAANHDSPLS